MCCALFPIQSDWISCHFFLKIRLYKMVDNHNVMELDIVYKNINRIIDLQDFEKNIFESLIEIITVKRKEFLLTEGEICRYEYFVLSGCLRSFHLDENLVDHTNMFAIEGWWTGSLKSFTQNIAAEFNIVALEDSKLIRLNKEKLELLFSKVPKFERYFRILLQNRLLATQDRVSSHLSIKATESYAKFCKKYPDIEQRVPIKYIASYLGITPTYLSRIRKIRL